MHPLTSSQKTFAAALVVFIASCGLYALTQHIIRSQLTEYLVARDAYARTLYEKENETRALEVLSKTADTRTAMEEYLLSVDEPLEFLALVDDELPEIAGASADLVSLSRELPNEEGGRKSNTNAREAPYVRVVMNAKADWSNLFHLLILLEHISYATDIERAILTVDETESEYEWSADIFIAGGMADN